METSQQNTASRATSALVAGKKTSYYWMTLAGVLLSAGGIPLLSGSAGDAQDGMTRAIAKAGVGAAVLLFALWLRWREARATQ